MEKTLKFEQQDWEYLQSLSILNGLAVEKFIMSLVTEFQNPDKEDKKIVDWGAFETFWKEYPKKEAKEPAKKSWKKLNPNLVLIDTIMKALAVHKQSKSWKSGFIPMASTWINQKRYNDEGLKTATGATIESKYDSPDVLKARQAAKSYFERIDKMKKGIL